MAAERDPRIRAAAATVLARSSSPADVSLAEAILLELSSDASDHGRAARVEVAAAIGEIDQPRFGQLLIPLLYDPAPEVADVALQSVQAAGVRDVLFVPTVVSLLRHRQLKERARDVLVSFGESVIDPLGYFLQDQEEDVWVRRHIPGTLARIVSQQSVTVLVTALSDPDGFVRFKAIAGLERLRRSHAELAIPREPVETQAVREANQYFTYLSTHDNLFRRGGLATDSLLALALEQKIDRARRRIYRLLSLIYPWKDVRDAQWALEHGDPHGRSSASEFLDNMLSGELRKWLMPVVEDLTPEEKLRRASVLVKAGSGSVEDTLMQLVDDEDAVIAAAAIDMIRQARLWQLMGRIEHVLAQRDGRDRCVVQAASWVRAARLNETEGQPDAPLAPWPIVAVAARLHALPLFASVTVDELFRIAGESRQIQHETGSPLAVRGDRPAFVHVLLDGAIAAEGGGLRREFGAPAVLAVLEALQASPMAETLRAAGPTLTLSLTVEEFRTALADNTDMVSGLFSMSVDQATARAHAVQPAGAASTFEELADNGLAAAEKIVVLEHVPLFEGLSALEARHIAEIGRTVPLRADTTLFTAQTAPAIWIVLSGAIELDGDGGVTQTAAAGSVIGALATLSGRRLGCDARVVRDGLALRIERDDLFDLLNERPALLRQLLTGVFSPSGSQPQRAVPPLEIRVDEAIRPVRENATAR
jgi:CRP-like cAMP-binding protein/HEAT repeat protein